MRTHRSSSALLFSTFALVVLVTAARPTAAADPVPSAAPAATTSPTQQADDLFLKGKALLKEGKKQDALAAYRAAFKLRKSYDVAGNLGSLELDLGLHRDAAEHIAYALSHYAASGTTQDQLAKARQRFETARKEVCVVHVAVSVEGAEVLVDGVSIGRAPIAEDVFVDPGARRIEARFPGYVTATKSLNAKKNGTEEVKLEMVREAAAVPTATASATATGSATALPPVGPRREILIGGAVLAGMATLVGGILLGAAESQRADLIAESPKNPDGTLICAKATALGTADAACDALRARGRTANALGQAGIGALIGGGLVGLGTVGYALFARAPQKATAVRWWPVASPTTAGLVCNGAF